jgi:cytochrome c553
LCRACGMLAAAHLDHIMPIAWFRWASMLKISMNDSTNLQGLCVRCHQEKQEREETTRLNVLAALKQKRGKYALKIMRQFWTNEKKLSRVKHATTRAKLANAGAKIRASVGEYEKAWNLLGAHYGVKWNGRGNVGGWESQVERLVNPRALTAKLWDKAISQEILADLRILWEIDGNVRLLFGAVEYGRYVTRRAKSNQDIARNVLMFRSKFYNLLLARKIPLSVWRQVAKGNVLDELDLAFTAWQELHNQLFRK